MAESAVAMNDSQASSSDGGKTPDPSITSATSERQGSAEPPQEGSLQQASPTSKSGPKVIYSRDYFNDMHQKIFTEQLDDPAEVATDPELPSALFEVVEHVLTVDTADKEKDDSGRRKAPRINRQLMTEIIVKSRAAIHALQTVVGYYPYVNLLGSAVHIQEPYLIVQHHREQLIRYRDQFKPGIPFPADCVGFKNTYEDVGLMLKLVDDRYGTALQEEEQRRQAETPRCTFNMLWSLFKPGMDVYWAYAEQSGEFNAAVVSNVACQMDAGKVVRLTVWYWWLECVDVWVGPSNPIPETIDPFVGEKEIASLRVFPCPYMRADKHKTTHEEMRTYLERRGDKYYSFLKGPKCARFDGESASFPKRHYFGDAMVDMSEYYKEGYVTPAPPELSAVVDELPRVVPRCLCRRCNEIDEQWTKVRTNFSDYMRHNTVKEEALTLHQRFLCTHSLPAFVFKLRAWKLLHVDGFRYPEWKTDLIDSLIIPEATRRLLEQLANRYTSTGQDAPWTADLVEGKGEGVIILLHGKPGIGKTYTAECVAEEAKRPLLALSCADIGIDPNQVEDNLEKWFKLATHWGAILLLDEADVYMERRTVTDLQRNNLVAGFLRKLEYYQGILFLTTNRVGTFDEAFLSRIDIPIYYRDFTPAQRVQIWETFFRKLETDREDTMRVSRRTRDYVKEDPLLLGLEWNARQIRSAFQTAVVLAEVEGERKRKSPAKEKALITVEPEHIAKTVEMSKDFKDYLKLLNQKNEAELAAGRRLRIDKFGVTEASVPGATPI